MPGLLHFGSLTKVSPLQEDLSCKDRRQSASALTNRHHRHLHIKGTAQNLLIRVSISDEIKVAPRQLEYQIGCIQ